jgi:hypothetical protein
VLGSIAYGNWIWRDSANAFRHGILYSAVCLVYLYPTYPLMMKASAMAASSNSSALALEFTFEVKDAV